MANQGFLNRKLKRFYKVQPLNQFIFNALLIFSISLTGCAASTTTFRVLDAETKEPIEGAVALAMWDSSTGLPGLSSRYTAKAVEAVTESDGVFHIPSPTGRLGGKTPRLKIYKPGYVGWDSRWIYLGCYEENKMVSRTKRREDFSMQDQDIFLEPWKDEYTFISHDDFIDPYATNLSEAGIQDSKYLHAIEYEVPFYIREKENILRKKRK